MTSPARISKERRVLLIAMAVTALAVTAAAAPAVAQDWMTTGTYTGDGTTGRAITGVGFQPDLVIVKEEEGDWAQIRTSTMPVGTSKALADNKNLVTDGILDFLADGFTVGNRADVNMSGKTYHWVAMIAGTGAMTVSSYTGDGTNDRFLSTSLDAQAALVICADDEKPVFHTYSMPWDDSFPFDDGGDISNALKGLLPGFMVVGPDNSTNKSGNTYHYVCWHTGEGHADEGYYTGDGNDGRDLINAAQEHRYVIIKADGSENAVQRMDTMTGDATLEFKNSGLKVDRIQALWASGFQVGTHITVNNSGQDYYVLAFGNPLLGTADLALTAGASPSAAAVGDTIKVAFALNNLGPDNATGITVTVSWPAGLTPVQVVSTQGTYDQGTGVWNVGSVQGGSGAGLAIDARVEPSAAGQTITASASVTATDQADPDNGNDSDSVDITVAANPQADLAVTKAVDDGTPDTGDTVTYTITVTNNGPDATSGVVVTDLLPSGVTYAGSSASSGSYAPASGAWPVGALSQGDSQTLTIDATVDAGNEGATITNTAAVTASSVSDPAPGNETDTAAITVTSANLALAQSVDDPTPDEGNSVTFTITLANNGPDAASGIVVADALPSGLTLQSATPSQGTWSGASGQWDAGSLASGLSATLALSATVDAGTGGTSLTNTATVTAADQGDPDSADNTSTATVTVTSADLALIKTVDNPSPAAGDTVTFTITATNYGPDQASGVKITDLLPGGLTFVGANPSSGGYVAATGAWTIGNITIGDDQTLTLQALVDVGYGGQTITNTATVSACNQSDPDPNNNSASAGIGILSSDLTVGMTVDDSAPGEGALVTFTLTVTNNGPSDNTGIQITDLLPDGLVFADATPGQGTYDSGTGIWDVGSLAAAATANLDLAANVQPGTAGTTLENAANVTAADLPDPDSANNAAAASLAVTGADLALAQSVDDPAPGEGALVTFTLTVTNNGPSAATGIQVSDLLPAGLTYAGDTPGQGSFDNGGGIWTVGDLGVGATAVLDLAASVDLGTAGLSFTNSASISALDQGDPDTDNDAASATVTVQAVDLQLASSVDNPAPMAGDIVNFTVTLSNAASTGVTGVVVRNKLPEGITLLDASATLGSFDAADSTWNIASLAADGNADLVLQARVDAIFATEPLNQTATITAVDQTDTQSANNISSASIVIAGIDLEIDKAVNVSTPRVDDPVTYTITVTNVGTGDATGVQITDILPAGVTFISSATARGSYDAGSGIWDIGNLAAGEAVTLSIGCTVAEGAAGTQVTNFAALTASDQPDAVTGNNSDTATFNVLAGLQQGTVQYWAGSGTMAVGLPGTTDRTQVLSLTLTNQGAAADAVTALTLTDLTEGTGTQAQLDAQWQELTLSYTRRGGQAITTQPVTGSFSDGRVTFNDLGWAIAPGDTLDLLVQSAPSLAAADNSRLRLGLADPGDLAVTQNVSVSGTWPLTDGSVIVVDGFSAAQATVIPVPAELFPVGSQDNLALTVDLPPNGYLPDALYGLGVANYGTAQPDLDISGMSAWADRGDGVFDPATDTLLGTLAYSGELWQISGLNTPIPPTGQRIFVTVDIAETARPTSDIRLGLPTGAGTAVEMYSGNDGPLGASLDNPHTQGISVTDRIILTSDFVHSGTVHPGARALNLLQFVLTNTYATDQPLQGLTVTNTARGPGGQARLDRICRQVTLRMDGNDNGLVDDLGTDPQLASGTFDSGHISFTGLSQMLPAGAGVRLFVTADLDLQDVADGDAVSAQVASAYDVDIPGATLVASWPLESGAEWTIDGLVSGQIDVGTVRTLTLGPDDGPVLAMDLTLPGNGGLGDQLQGISFTNLGTAGAADVAQARLWADGGNGSFDGGGGDDLLIGPLNLDGGTWSSTVLSRAVPAEGLRLFVGVDVTSSPSDSVTVQLTVPVNGILFASSNDGPLDAPVASGGTLTISTSPLRSDVDFDTTASNVGQAGTITMTVTNAGAEVVTGIIPALQTEDGDGAITLQDPVPASLADLAPGQSSQITWAYTGTTAGTIALSGNASGTVGADQVRRSIQTPTAPHRIFNPVDHLDLYPTMNLPFSLNRGQEGLVPLTLTFMNPGDGDMADAQLAGMSLRFMETPTGPDIAPGDLIHRITISEGTEIYLDRTDLPHSGSRLDLVFDRAVRITSEEPVTLGIKFDLDLNSTAPSFLISITDPTWFNGNDAVDLRTVPVQLGEGAFPVQTGQATLVTPASGLDVSLPAGQETLATPGQQDVPLLQVRLANSAGDDNSSTIEVGSMTFLLRDEAGVAISHPDTLLDRVALRSMFLDHFSGPPTVTADTLITLLLSPPVTVPGGGTMDLSLHCDLGAGMPLGTVTAAVAGPSGIDARDGNMNNPVPVTLTTDESGPPVTIVAPATAVVVSGGGHLPTSLARGARDATALTVTLANPHPAGSAAIACDGLVLRFLGADHGPLDPDSFLDRIRVRCGDDFPGVVVEPASADGTVTVPLSTQTLAPSAPGVSLDILLDLKSDAPLGAMEVVVDNAGILAHDAITRAPVTATLPDGGPPYLSSGTTWIVQPADELQVGFQDLMPPLLAPANSFTPVMGFDLLNPATEGHGAVDLVTLAVVQGSSAAKMAPAHLGTMVAGARLRAGDEILATVQDVTDSADSLVMTLTPPLSLAAGQSRQVTVEIAIRDAAPAGSLQLSVKTGGLLAVQEGSTGSPVHVSPVGGTSFPFVTQVGNLGARDFASSFINFPNPFPAGRTATTFSYVLPADARVSLRILTPHGRVVTTLLQEQPRAAGLHQEDLWLGLNNRGTAVHNGVYLAELRVTYDDGSSAKALRKVGVVR